MGGRWRHSLAMSCVSFWDPGSPRRLAKGGSALRGTLPIAFLLLQALFPSVFPTSHTRTQVSSSGPPSNPLPPDITEVFITLNKPVIQREGK